MKKIRVVLCAVAFVILAMVAAPQANAAVSGGGAIFSSASVVGETTGTGATSLGTVDAASFINFSPWVGTSMDVETQCTARNMTASPHTSRFMRRHTVFAYQGSAWAYKGSDLLGSVIGDLDLSMALISTSVSSAGGTVFSVDVNGAASVDIYWVCSVTVQLGIVN